jgi:hypothetical protein
LQNQDVFIKILPFVELQAVQLLVFLEPWACFFPAEVVATTSAGPAKQTNAMQRAARADGCNVIEPP